MYSFELPRLTVQEQRAGYKAGPIVPEPRSPGSDPVLAVAGEALVVLRGLCRLHGRLARITGDHLGLLRRTRWHDRLAYDSFGDFVREVLQMAPRTATRRIALSRLLQESPRLEAAFETGRLSACQVLALSRIRGEPDLEYWITLAEDASVRELEKEIATHLPDQTMSGKDFEDDSQADPPGRRVTFAAPLSAAVAWENGMEMARRVLGWEAPPHRCVDALLAEVRANFPPQGGVDTRDCGDEPSKARLHGETGVVGNVLDTGKPLPAEYRSPPSAALRVKRRDLQRLKESIRTAQRELKAVAAVPPPSAADPEHSLTVLSDLKRTERGLRLLMVRLVRDASAANVLAYLGYGSVTEFLVCALKMSRRTAARFLSEAWIFEDNPRLAAAFATGRIGLGQAYLVNRVAVTSNQEAFIRRAEAVTHLQFEREVRFQERLADYLPSVAAMVCGPLPLEGLEAALKEQLADLGWSETDIEERIGVVDGGDPAVNAVLMTRLETLLDLVALQLEAHDLAVADVPTLAAESNETRTMPTLAPESSRVPTLAGQNAPGPSSDRLHHHARRTTISFWAPESTITEWVRALNDVRAVHGPLPTWAAALALVQTAVHEWERIDPSRKPAKWKIFERDQWRCQAPGCSSRRKLEVHHILFRSHRGSDDPENLITLCHGHHRRGIHDGALRVQGAAPGKLRWRLGGGRSSITGKPIPSRLYDGSKLVSAPIATRDTRITRQ